MEVIERKKVEAERKNVEAEKELPPIKEEEEEDTSKAKAQVFCAAYSVYQYCYDTIIDRMKVWNV